LPSRIHKVHVDRRVGFSPPVARVVTDE